MSKLNDRTNTVKARTGLRANLLKVANYFIQGEFVYTTDTKHLFISDGTSPQPVQSLDMTITNNGEVITHNDEVIFNY